MIMYIEHYIGKAVKIGVAWTNIAGKIQPGQVGSTKKEGLIVERYAVELCRGQANQQHQ